MLTVFGVNVLDPWFLAVPPVGATLITLFVVWLKRVERFDRYRILAARYAGYEAGEYWRMLESGEDWSEKVVEGINNHQAELLRRGEELLLSIGEVRQEDLRGVSAQIEKIMDHFFLACLEDKDDLWMVRKELKRMRVSFSGMILGHDELNDYFKHEHKRWLEDLWHWEEIVIFLRPHYKKPNFRSMNL